MNRRTLLKSAGFAAGGLAASASLPGFGGGQAKAQENEGEYKKGAPKVWKDNSGRPNILVIMVDQLRFPQGLFTQEIMDRYAPNLKELREMSVSFESHFAAAAMCTPSRSTMLTGLYTHQNGQFLTNTPIAQVPDLDPGFPTWGSILNSSDFRYNTYWWGKWHLSSNDATTPDYAQQYGFIDGGLPCPAPNTGLGRGLQGDPLTVEVFQDWLNRYTNSDSASAPWCTTVSLTNPHDIAWYPNCTFGSLPESPLPPVRPQPGEDLPLKVHEFTDLPPNFEVWPEAGLPGASGVPGAQGKPRLQELFWAFEEIQAGFMPADPTTPEERLRWHQLLDLYVQVTGFVDDQIGDVLNRINDETNYPGLKDNTIIVFTADHGEYGGSHGLRNKGFAVYEESIHVPFYVYDPTGAIIPESERGSTRDQFTSHVDLLPLLMSLASGDNAWRQDQQYAHLAGRADLFAMLSDPDAEGREYIISTSDEDYPEFLNIAGRNGSIPQEVVDRLNEIICALGVRPPGHVIGYRTRTAKLGVYSDFAEGTIDIVQGASQEAELYNYAADGIDEVINHALNGSAPDPILFASMYEALFNPSSGAVATELRQPLPNRLRAVQRRAIDEYLVFQQTQQLTCAPAPAGATEASPEPADTSAPQLFIPLVER